MWIFKSLLTLHGHRYCVRQEELTQMYAHRAQLVYLEKKGYIDAVCGNTELFLFDIEKVIVNFNLSAGQFAFVSKSRLRSDTQLSNDQFIDAILLSGCSFCRTFPPLENPAQQSGSIFLDAVAMVKRFRSVGNAITSHPDQQTGYLDKFRKARAAIKHHVILREDGKVEQMELHESPNDVHEFIGERLPEELYFYLSRGMVGPQVMDMITTGEFIQSAPLDNNESEEFKKFLDVLNVMRTESVSLLAKSLHRYWVNREVKVYNWFDATHPKTLIHKDIPYPSDLVQKWNVREDIWGPEMDKQKVEINCFCICFNADDRIAMGRICVLHNIAGGRELCRKDCNSQNSRKGISLVLSRIKGVY
jgi:hypothetical protein